MSRSEESSGSARLRQLADGLWVTEGPQRFFGVELGARTTIARLDDGTLLVHSPIEPDDSLLNEVSALGRVAQLVAPNCFHHLHLGKWKDAFPEATLHLAPGLQRKRADLDGRTLSAERPLWGATLEQLALDGLPALNETLFFHRASRTLIATDLAFNIDERSPPLTRFAFRLAGTYKELSPTFLERLLVRDRAMFRASLERMFAWPFERVIVSHGAVSERGGREQLQRGYAWALR